MGRVWLDMGALAMGADYSCRNNLVSDVRKVKIVTPPRNVNTQCTSVGILQLALFCDTLHCFRNREFSLFSLTGSLPISDIIITAASIVILGIPREERGK